MFIGKMSDGVSHSARSEILNSTNGCPPVVVIHSCNTNIQPLAGLACAPGRGLQTFNPYRGCINPYRGCGRTPLTRASRIGTN